MKHNAPTILAAAAITALLAGCAPSSEPAPDTSSEAAEPSTSASTEPVTPDTETTASETPITITAGDTVITATLNDTEVAQDFAAMLPIELPWFRNYGIEYITELDTALTETGPFYTEVQPGDIVYYNPLDSITIIYEETSSVPTLTLMGEITSDLAVFDELPDDVDLLIELAD